VGLFETVPAQPRIRLMQNSVPLYQGNCCGRASLAWFYSTNIFLHHLALVRLSSVAYGKVYTRQIGVPERKICCSSIRHGHRRFRCYSHPVISSDMWLRYGRLGLLLRLHSRGTGGARKKDEAPAHVLYRRRPPPRNCALSHRRVPLRRLPPSFTDKVGVEGGKQRKERNGKKKVIIYFIILVEMRMKENKLVVENIIK
jgi:hypothetical protein